MFRSKRSGLVRRLWRSRLVTDKDSGDGSKRSERVWDDSCGSIPENIHKTELLPMTRTDSPLGTFCEVINGSLSGDQGDPSHYSMGVNEHRGSRKEQESDSGSVTCCLFREREPRLRSHVSAQINHYHAHPKNSGRENGLRPVIEQELKNVTYAFLKKIKEKLLDALLEAVESKGGMSSECVLVPQTELRLGGHPVSPQYLFCKLYRWTDLQHTAQLKALCHCQSFGRESDNTTACCNPFHYSRLCGPESPPPPYSRLSPSEELKPLHLSDSTLSYTETVALQSPTLYHVRSRDYTDSGTSLGSSACGSQRSHWCSVAYWEQRTRVGRLYSARNSSLSIFYDLPQGNGLCLGQLNANAYHSLPGGTNHRDNTPHSGSHNSNRSHGSAGNGGNGAGSCVQRTRSKIGFGIVLSQEPDGVWVYNRSQHPVFIHSPTLDVPNARGLTVKRVMPGYSLKVFDYERSSWIVQASMEPDCQEGPYDPHSVRISFAKGWGPCYSRQFITSCPCWLEVLLNNHR
ncbi:mothers against decapentaplegic homolog 6a [Aplochiton taeniatus]